MVLGALLRLRQRHSFDTPRERAVHDTLHTAVLAAPALRRGLSAESAAEAVPHLRALLGTAATAITDADGVLLAWHGSGEQHAAALQAAAARAATRGRRELLDHAELDCGRLDCPVRALVVVPLVPAGNGVVGVLGAVSTVPAGPGLLRAAGEVARYASSQIEPAELDENRTRLASAEVRALRAQISPHFIYNALTTVASFVRTDPERARDLVLEFADFTRYSFRSAGGVHHPGRRAAQHRPLPHPGAGPLRSAAAGAPAGRPGGAGGGAAVPGAAAAGGERGAPRPGVHRPGRDRERRRHRRRHRVRDQRGGRRGGHGPGAPGRRR